jgi:hypothetical protein
MPTTHDGFYGRSIRLDPSEFPINMDTNLIRIRQMARQRINDRVVDCTHLESERTTQYHRFESYFIRSLVIKLKILRKPCRFILIIYSHLQPYKL